MDEHSAAGPEQKKAEPASLTDGSELSSGTLFAAGQYRIVRLLGRGASSSVYEAEHLMLAQRVALKIFPKTIFDDPSAVIRFQTEAKAVAMLSHPNIVAANAAGISENNAPYIATELVDGRSLEEILSNSKFLSQEQLLNIFSQILDALEYAHQQNIVHRDLKPSNIMVSDAGLVKILDFGIAKMLNSTQTSLSATQTGNLVGSPSYMSPEQASGAQVSVKSDIYSIGILIFECVSGKPPFMGDSPLHLMYKHLHEAPPDLVLPAASTLNVALLDKLIKRCLVKDPAMRYPTARGIKEELTQILAEVQEARAALESASKAPTKMSLSFLLPIVIVCAVSGFFFLSRPASQKDADNKIPLRKGSGHLDSEEFTHHTSYSKIGRNTSDPVTSILMARNDYHSSDHYEMGEKKTELVNRSIKEYDRVLTLLLKNPDRYLQYLASVGKARALSRLYLIELSKGSSKETLNLILERSIQCLKDASHFVPENSYEYGVINLAMGEAYLILYQPEQAKGALYTALKLKERDDLAWSPDADKYVDKREGLAEQDKPDALLRTYSLLIELEKRTGNLKALPPLLEKMFLNSRLIRDCTEPHYFRLLCDHADELFARGKKSEARSVLVDLEQRADDRKGMDEERSLAYLALAKEYHKFNNNVEASRLLKQAASLATESPSVERANSIKELRKLIGDR